MLNQQMPPYQPPQGLPQMGAQQPPMQAPQGGWGQAPVGASDGGGLSPLGQMQNPVSIQQPNAAPIGRGGMFGSGRSAGDLISSFILNYAAANGNPIGTNYLQGQRYKQQMALEQQQYEARQQSELQRQMALYQYQVDHPNDEMTQAIRQAGLDPHSTQAQAMFAQRAQTLASPLQAFDYQGPDGTVTKQFFRPGPMSPVPGATPPTAPVGKLTPIQGGPGSPAPATFRY